MFDLNTILEQVIAGLLVAIVVAMARFLGKKARLSLRHLEGKLSDWLIAYLLITNFILQKFYLDVNLIQLDGQIQIERKPQLENQKGQNGSSIYKYLPRIHIKLPSLWDGAIETYYSNNPDKDRQFMCSLRELFTRLLHILASEDDIKKWAGEQSYFHNGKPTRKARIEYICRNISGKPSHELKDNKIKSALKLMDILQVGTHSLETEFLLQDLFIVKAEAEATLTFLLEVEFQINGHAALEEKT